MKRFLFQEVANRMTLLRNCYIKRGHPQIYDELCSCGHYLSHHHDTFDYGHGFCLMCDCKQFTWAGFLVKQ